jgi:lysophospholipase L1-like esterase
VVGIDERFEKLANGIMSRTNTDVLKLLPLLNNDRYFIPSDSHTSKAGNQVIAKALAEKITPLIDADK